MSNELVTQDFTAEKIELIKHTVAQGSTDLELKFFIEQCKRTGLDPVTRQIYFIKDRKGKVNIQTSIDGLRLIAERSGDYQGQTPAQWCGDDGKWIDVWLSDKLPAAARVGVWKKNFREPLYAVAVFSEYAQRTQEGNLNYIWDSKPALMISKVAEALALRKAFPNDMSGIYTQDEYTPDTEKPKAVTKVTVVDNQSAPTQPADIVTSSEQIQDPSYVIKFGKFKGQPISSIEINELLNYAGWIENAAKEAGKPMKADAQEFIQQVQMLVGNLK